VTTPVPDLERTAVFAAAGSRLRTVTPCRVVDTRTSGDPLAAFETRTSTIAGACGVSASAYAAVLNLTAVAPATSGHLS
jgi:hypothetical protein